MRTCDQGAVSDQWSLNRSNFEGCWQGKGSWFERNGDEPMDLLQPSRLIDPTRYEITFSDPETGLWDGSGLFFAPRGQARYSISRSTCNAGGGCWQFDGTGGQSSRRLDVQQPRFGHEINLFQGRSRSMLVLIWIRSGEQWLLQVVGAVGFRCQASSFQEPERPPCRSLPELLEPLRGWSGSVQRLIPLAGVDSQPSGSEQVRFVPEELLINPCSAVMPDGLVFSVPERMTSGPFRLEVGCLLSPDLFQQISILFDESGELTCWERKKFTSDRR